MSNRSRRIRVAALAAALAAASAAPQSAAELRPFFQLAGPPMMRTADRDQAGRVILAIASPASEETVHNNDGDVHVEVIVLPDLAPGQRIALLLDGEVVARQTSGSFELTALDRGAHTLQAQLVDRVGTVLAASDPVTFYMWRASALFPNRRR